MAALGEMVKEVGGAVVAGGIVVATAIAAELADRFETGGSVVYALYEVAVAVGLQRDAYLDTGAHLQGTGGSYHLALHGQSGSSRAGLGNRH